MPCSTGFAALQSLYQQFIKDGIEAIVMCTALALRNVFAVQNVPDVHTHPGHIACASS